jgi:alkylation response protein AidB-like acyl-CoA dehydrogenase
LREELKHHPPLEHAKSWLAYDREFSKRVAQKGWIGMTWPKCYGGGEATSLDRYVVVEEMLLAGAPVLSHWIADRQSGPLILRFGTEAQKQRYLPAITRGEMCFAIGMSEPNVGSDLASVGAKAMKVPGGWRVNGTKIWTSNAHRCEAMIALFRTGAPDSRQAGLTQFIVDMPAEGVTVNPILDMTGEHHFNEVVFEDCFLADEQLLGAEGTGWAQVTSELTLERSGPERFMSSLPLLGEFVKAAAARPAEDVAEKIGRLVARHAVLRQMSMSIAGQLQQNRDPQLEAACLKDLGGNLEQLVPRLARNALSEQPIFSDAASRYVASLARTSEMAPSFSIRGGAREILRSIIARGAGLR